MRDSIEDSQVTFIHGFSGCGKTTLVREACDEIGKGVFYFAVSELLPKKLKYLEKLLFSEISMEEVLRHLTKCLEFHEVPFLSLFAKE